MAITIALAIALLAAVVVYISNRVAGAVIALALAVRQLVQAWSATEARLTKLEASDDLADAQRGTARAYRDLTASLVARAEEINRTQALISAPVSKSTH